ncbi:double-stranded RNA-binding protein 1-like [Argentina anserina]|uniref:double-stranded RNA-binding protein 1-like n=1 Tax=Argentina anserina TaxID=57926 RepID=UPI0021764DBA|nr:double-stranded RNA-binding protein 1-like [Potentilla anserina]
MNLNKCKLQELCQSKGWAMPHYSGFSQGPPHLSASVLVLGFTFHTKTPFFSKRDAECSAAGLALDYFDQNPLPKRPKSLSFPLQPSPLASLPPPSPPGMMYLTYKDNEVWNETTSG